MPYRKSYKNETDDAVLGVLPPAGYPAPVGWLGGVREIAARGFRLGTVRASLKRLMESGKVVRVYHGNGRYGRYVYAKLGRE